MSMFSTLKGMDQKFSWSFLGLVLAIVFFCFGLYTTFVYEKKPELVFQVLSEAPVYSLNEDVAKLDVLFDGEDIRKKNETLTLLTLRIANLGNADILKSSFDPDYLPAIVIRGGRVIKADVIDASSQYLKDAARLLQLDGDRFLISPVIMESDEYFDVKFLLLHNQDAELVYSAAGKLVGVNQLRVVRLFSEKAELTFWNRVLGGNLLVQSSRVLVYFIGCLVFAIMVIASSLALKEWVEESRRRGYVKRFKQGSGLTFNELDECVFERYISEGEFSLLRISHLLSDEHNLSERLAALDLAAGAGKEEIEVTFSQSEVMQFGPSSIESSDKRTLRFLVDQKIVVKTAEKCEVSQSARHNVQQFVLWLSVLTPKQIRAARGVQGTYGTESNPVRNIDSLGATSAQEPKP